MVFREYGKPVKAVKEAAVTSMKENLTFYEHGRLVKERDSFLPLEDG
ncbi:MAG: hypothetical protein LUH58_08585 [Lachnospiraceae bacterium]|nr:hypothetical protein [Lachnospiraceae bacterium]